MMQPLPKTLLFVITAVLAVGCGSEHNGSVLLPTDVNSSTMSAGASSAHVIDPFSGVQASSLLGTWTQTTRIGTQAITSLPSPNSCTEFQFTMTSQNATSASGTFIAQCPGNLTLTG